MATEPYGSLRFPLNQSSHWKKNEIMGGGKRNPPPKGILSFPAKLTGIKRVSRCPAMVMVSKGRNRYCCPNKQNKWSLTPHLPDPQLGKAGQRPPEPQSNVRW